MESVCEAARIDGTGKTRMCRRAVMVFHRVVNDDFSVCWCVGDRALCKLPLCCNVRAIVGKCQFAVKLEPPRMVSTGDHIFCAPAVVGRFVANSWPRPFFGNPVIRCGGSPPSRSRRTFSN